MSQEPTFAETLLDFLSAHGYTPDMWALFNAREERQEDTAKALNEYMKRLEK